MHNNDIPVRVALLAASLGFLPYSGRADGIVLTSDALEGRITSPEEGWPAGTVVPVTLLGSGDAGEAIRAWDVTLRCDGEQFRIRSVEFNPAYSRLGGGATVTMPAAGLRALLLRPRDATDTPGDGPAGPTWLARVELQVLVDAAFEAKLLIRARGISDEAWAELGRSAGRADAETRAEEETSVTLENSGVRSPADEAQYFDYVQVAASVQVRPMGGGDSLASLQPHTEYELHYTSPDGAAEGYTLFVLGRTSSQRLDGVAPPSGEGAAAEMFSFVQPQSPPGAGRPGVYRYQTIMDDGLTPDGAATDGTRSGYLCNFTTGAGGPVVLDLLLSRTDWEAGETVEMRAMGQFAVE